MSKSKNKRCIKRRVLRRSHMQKQMIKMNVTRLDKIVGWFEGGEMVKVRAGLKRLVEEESKSLKFAEDSIGILEEHEIV